MKTAAAIVAILICCRPGAGQAQSAQNKQTEQLTPTVRLYVPKNINEMRARQVADFVNSVLGKGVRVDWDDVPHALVIRAPDPTNLDAAEALLRRFDVANVPEAKMAFQGAQNADCTVYLVRASKGEPGSNSPGTAIPPALQSAIDEMKSNFGYDHFALWDSENITQSSGEFQGILPSLPGQNPQAPYVFTMDYKGAYYRPQDKSTQFNDFLFSIKMPSGIESHIKTPVTIHEGQKLVLGKLRLLPGENADLFLVLMAKTR